jgi:predicted transcriptional regulator
MTRTLHIQVGTTPDRSDLDERFAAMDAGETVESRPSRLRFESLEPFGRAFRPTNLELLEAIAEREPESIRELARFVDRHPPEVTENVHELVDYGLVELREEGRAKRPTIWYDTIEFSGDVPLRETGSGGNVSVSP